MLVSNDLCLLTVVVGGVEVAGVYLSFVYSIIVVGSWFDDGGHDP